MKRVLPVVLLFAVLLALTVAREVARGRLDQGGTDSDEYVRLAPAAFEPKDVASIEVTAPGGAAPAYVVERRDAAWEMTKPFRAPGHDNHVEDLCRALAAADGEPRADDPGSLRDFDLTPERAVEVRLADAAGKTLAHVAVGRGTGRRGAFVRLLGNATDHRAFETTTDLRGLLGLAATAPGDAPQEPKPSQFRNFDFPQMKVADPVRLEFTAPGRRVVLARKDGKWVAAEGGPGVPVNDAGIDRVLAKLRGELRANDLADPADVAKLGLAEPAWTVVATDAAGGSLRVTGSLPAGDEGYVRIDSPQDPPVVYVTSSWEFQTLFPTGSGLFNFPNVEIADADMTRVVVERDGSRIEMTRAGTKPTDDWALVAPESPLTPRQASLRSLAGLLRNVKAVDWIDGGALGAAEATVRIGRAGAPDDAAATIRIGGKSPSGRDRLAELPNLPGRVVVLADSTVDRLLPGAASIFEPKVLHGWTASDVASVSFAPAGGAGAFSVERRDGAWTLRRGGAEAPAGTAAAARWVEALLALETRELPGPGGADEATVTVTRTDGIARTLAFGPEKDGRRTVRFGTLAFETDRRDLLPAADSFAAPDAPTPAPPKEK